ncbi:hypothetical protein QYE76_021303 [Lolium multiflorum]|uniref:Uncharacterized protein n=1 Tax=Lolium multiflorum TaxID=4521 RepID=A0AAD8VS35_LOLMU|nr:hypothetical protein QYE76_021303 [Lolium multiflorum]
MDLTLSWFSRRIQPLKFNKRLICEYSGVDDQLWATKDNLPTYSLNKRIWTLVKLTWGQEVPEINKDMYIDNKCPPLNTLADDGFRDIFCIPTDAGKVEDDPEDEDKGEEQVPKKKTAPRATKRPHTKVSRFNPSDEASAKKAKTTAPSCPSTPISEVACRIRRRTSEKDHIRNFPTPLSSVRKDGSNATTKRTAPEEAQDKGLGEAEVTSADKAEATADDAINHKREIGEFFDQLLCKRKEQQALHYELHKNISLQCRVTLGQADQIHDAKERIVELEKMLAETQGASTSLATASSELENLRSTHKDLESKLKEAEEKRELAEKQLWEKNSDFLREKADLVEKRRKDIATLKRLQADVQTLRTYMRMA